MRKNLILYIVLIGLPFCVEAQWKDYMIGVKGDTLNRIDKQNRKQGAWIQRFEQVRGEPGYEEEGVYENDRKTGTWRKFNLQGDLFAIENYRWGFKDGISQYFDIMGNIVREESWRGFNPEQAYDTLDVEDVDRPGNYKTVVIKNEGSSLKHGTWKFFDNQSGMIQRTEFYLLGTLQTGGVVQADKKMAQDSVGTKTKTKPKEVLEFEKANAGKKKVKVRDGSTGN
jgi:hypothetical protein